jgi:CheY-like chemotaxis protein
MQYRVLTVDDDPQTTGALRRLLEKAGYLVLEENDAAQALAKAREFQPHVVILDFYMPRVHGGDVAWQLSSDPKLRQTKLIMCSGHTPAAFAHKLPPAKIEIVEKPVDADKLLALLAESVAGVGAESGAAE